MCSSSLQTFSYIYPWLPLLMIILVTWCLYKFINDTTKEMPKLLYISIISFYLFLGFTFVGSAVTRWIYCTDHNAPLFIIFHTIFYISYPLHWLCMLSVLFLRLYHVFKGSVFKLSKLSIIIFVICYVSCLPAVLLNLPFWRIRIFTVYGGFIVIILSIYVSSLFIYKLLRIHAEQAKNNETDIHNSNSSFLPLVTKFTILTAFPVFTSLLTLIIFALKYSITDQDAADIIVHSLLFMVLFTNLICITLSMRYCAKYYSLICDPMDKCCILYCTKKKSFSDSTKLSAYISSVSKSKDVVSTDDTSNNTNKTNNITMNQKVVE